MSGESSVLRTEPVDQAKPVRVAEASDAAWLELKPVGNGQAFVHVLARIIVRRELITAGLIPAPVET